jgi:hypothetical protein
MSPIEVRRFDAPDERRPFEGKGAVDVVRVAGDAVVRGVFEPGWRWSVNARPLVGTDSCRNSHLSYVVAGRMRIVMDDGVDTEVGPGDIVAIPPGHDAEVVGEETCVIVDLAAMRGDGGGDG